MMIISGDKVSKADIENEDNWEPYTEKKNWELSANNNGLNRIHLYLKDKAGNIFNSLLVSYSSNEKSTYTVTYEGAGENISDAKEATPGMIFSVSTKAPKNENKYFLGWSLVADGSVQWGRDGTIEPRYIKGNTTLYAVYSDTAPKLAAVVEIGDYIDYPVEYENVYDAIGTGWRVLNISGDQVQLVSEGTPLEWMLPAGLSVGKEYSALRAVKELTNNFVETEFSDSGFDSSISSNFTNKYTESVRALKKEDLDILTKGKIKNADEVSQYGTLVRNGSPYYLATAFATSDYGSKFFLYCVHNNNSNEYSTSHGNAGNYLGSAWMHKENTLYFSGYSTVEKAFLRS